MIAKLISLTVATIATCFIAVNIWPTEAKEQTYIIIDGYTNGEINHQVTNHQINIDQSISFISDDGLLWTIPYPYYQIKNKND